MEAVRQSLSAMGNQQPSPVLGKVQRTEGEYLLCKNAIIIVVKLFFYRYDQAVLFTRSRTLKTEERMWVALATFP